MIAAYLGGKKSFAWHDNDADAMVSVDDTSFYRLLIIILFSYLFCKTASNYEKHFIENKLFLIEI